MTYMNNIGPDEIARRKTKSDYINNTDALTFATKEANKNAEAYKSVREKKDQLEMLAINNEGLDTYEL